ncbi:MAG: ABC transporter permease [Propionibacteriaceae bacterium]|nr:ABC transporter permease [Propionibacteriaceae bacterium]
MFLFVMANLMLATIAIENSVNVSMAAAKEKLGGVVYLTVDADSLQEQLAAQRENRSGETDATSEDTAAAETETDSTETDADAETAETAAAPTFTIPEALAQAIGESEYLSGATYSITATANAASYTPVDTVQNQREREMQEQFANMREQVEGVEEQFNQARDQFNAQQRQQQQQQQAGAPGGGQGGFGLGGGGAGGARFNFDLDFDISDPTLSGGDTTLQGIDDFNFVSEVEAGTVNLASGEVYTATTTNAAIVSQALLDDNSLQLGDTITLKTLSDETEITLSIVGSYKSSSVDESGADTFNNNTIYVNVATAKTFMTAAQIEALTVSNAKYYLTKAEDKDAFLTWANDNYAAQLSGLKLDIDDSSYQTMVGPIEKVGSFAQVMMWVVIAASALIITLIVVINVKERRYEMGVLLSLGAKRASIVGQICCELVIAGTIGFLLSLGTSQLVANQVGESLLAGQVAQAETTTTTDVSTGFTSPMGNGAFPQTTRFGQQTAVVTDAKPITEIDVSAGTREYLMLFGLGYGVLLASLILPTVNILRYQPKTILTGKE